MEESKGGEPPRSASAVSGATLGRQGQKQQHDPMIVASDPRDGTDIPEFSLCAALVGHAGDVRSLSVGKGHLYSGARDNVVMAWPLDEDGNIFGTHSTPAAKITLPDWVNALTVTIRGGDEEETIVAGCKDGGIYVIAWEGGQGDESAAATGGGLVVKTTLLGHDAPISSLSWTAEGLLLSGSWDETAKAWDLDTAKCVWTLGGHENNVCVLGLGPSSIATGSTGLNVDGHLVGEQIRMWEGSPPKECRSLTDHTSGIRDLCLVDADADEGSPSSSSSSSSSLSSSLPPGGCFCSASNDGSVRAWSSRGDCRAIFTVPDESFVFSISHLGGGLVAAGDDAGNLCAALVPSSSSTPAATAVSGAVDKTESARSNTSSSPPVRETATVLYKHPKTVWSVAALRPAVPRRRQASAAPSHPSTAAGTGGGGAAAAVGFADVATGSADHAVRIFTPDAARALRGDRLKEAQEALEEVGYVCTAVPGGGGGGGGLGGVAAIGGGKLPSVSEMGVMVGDEDGQLSAFVDEGTGDAQVFRWVQVAGEGRGKGKWEPLGALRPPVRKVAFEGGLYDKVIPVEVESASRGFLRLQLGVNDGDDPKKVADAFCQKHSLGPEYLPQIEQFLFIASL